MAESLSLCAGGNYAWHSKETGYSCLGPLSGELCIRSLIIHRCNIKPECKMHLNLCVCVWQLPTLLAGSQIPHCLVVQLCDEVGNYCAVPDVRLELLTKPSVEVPRNDFVILVYIM